MVTVLNSDGRWAVSRPEFCLQLVPRPQQHHGKLGERCRRQTLRCFELSRRFCDVACVPQAFTIFARRSLCSLHCFAFAPKAHEEMVRKQRGRVWIELSHVMSESMRPKLFKNVNRVTVRKWGNSQISSYMFMPFCTLPKNEISRCERFLFHSSFPLEHHQI